MSDDDEDAASSCSNYVEYESETEGDDVNPAMLSPSPTDCEESEAMPSIQTLDAEYLSHLRTFNINISKEEHSDDGQTAHEFILMDIDVATNQQHGTSVLLFGRTCPSNQSIHVNLLGWYPSLCIEEPKGWKADVHSEKLKAILHQKIRSRLEEGYPYAFKFFNSLDCDVIVKIKSEKGTNIMGYSPVYARNKSYLKIWLASALFVRPLRECFEGGYTLSDDEEAGKGKADGFSFFIEGDAVQIGGGSGEKKKTCTFNSNFEPVLQFMVDMGIVGCQWCRISGPVSLAGRRSNCDLEITDCRFENLTLLDLGEKSDAGSIRILSFDLEAAGRKGVFPDPAIDPVIQIGIQFQIHGATMQTLTPVLLSFKKCACIEGTDVFSFENETSMLIAFRDIMLHFDPDIITGYNICNFDTDYLKKRAETLDIAGKFCGMTRMRQQKLHVREVVFQSAQVGKRKNNKVTIKGRAVLDVYKWMKDNFSLEEYSLNAVSAKFLGDAKEDIHFTEITPKWQQGPETRKELGIYCLKDALLPLHLMEKLNITLNAIERARVTGLPCEWVLNRGMLVRFTSQLMRESAEKGYLLPNIGENSPLRQETTKYTGATVLDVERGLWTNVAVLDFSSMYPCQIIAENLCYSTYLGRNSWPSYPLTEKPLYFQGHKFVSDKDRKGVIPCILERMLKQRKIAKAAFAEETQDPVKKLVLKARELSYKVVCNGIYGALGCRNALIPLRAIAETTTGLGRKDIQRVKEIAESMFTTGKGYAGNAKVVCGDTDSVFVSMPLEQGVQGLDAIAESMRMANLLADAVNGEMKKPKKIEPEKVFANILLMKKKRYAGLKYENLTDPPKVDIKGIECVRRDGCPLVRNLVKETAERLAVSADVEAAAQLVRITVGKVMEDSVPDEDYAIKKMLRKSMQDCSHPMTSQELIAIRKAIRSEADGQDSQLSEAEQDKAIRQGVKLPWRVFRKMPHIMVAWKLRLKDPGSAPVVGEGVHYVICLNGGKLVSEKAEPLQFVLKGSVIVDRHFYLASLRKAIDGLFTPIIEQRHALTSVGAQVEEVKIMSADHLKKVRKMQNDTFNVKVQKDVEDLLWRQLLDGKLSRNKDKQKALVHQSPIMQAFKRAAERADATLPPKAKRFK